jgi:hypothetical protein
MPYIKQPIREVLANEPTAMNAGELNYLFTTLINRYLSSGLSYQRINDIMGALEGAKLEMYRRVAVPYEEIKLQENGDVYDENHVVKGAY